MREKGQTHRNTWISERNTEMETRSPDWLAASMYLHNDLLACAHMNKHDGDNKETSRVNLTRLRQTQHTIIARGGD